MAEIYNSTTRNEFEAGLKDMDEGQLLAQSLVQQGAIHAVSHLLKLGCSEESAIQMLQSLRESATAIRTEAQQRGKPDLFTEDQTEFH